MANDIIGGPEPIIINSRLFQFSPLNDFELSALDSWVSWRLEKRCEALSDEGLSELNTVAGSAQLLYQSVRRTCSETVIQLAEFIDGNEYAIEDIYIAWWNLNWGEFDFGSTTIGTEEISDAKTAKANSNEIYLHLSRLYRWTPQQIAMLTPYQQLVYIRRFADEVKNDTVRHETVQEYQEWMLSKQNAK